MSSYRSYRGRGRGGGGNNGPRGGGSRRDLASHIPPPVSDEPFGSEIDKIKISDLLIEEDAPTIENVNYLASYNWLDSKYPMILVPGSPPAWSPPSKDVKLPADSGIVYRDINAARYPEYPMEPAVRSILALEPNFNLQAVDLVACGSTIGNLLRFAGSLQKPFRFDADLVGDTVFFIRKERTPTESIENLRGYGHTFPEQYTTWDRDVGGSCSHQRIIEYDFADLHIVVRSESDGYIREQDSRTTPKEKPSAKVQSTIDEEFVKLGVGNAAFMSDKLKLDLRMQGVKRPQSQIFDIKTRRSLNIFDMEEILPRLWINQTPNFLLAYHEFGLFNKPQVSNVKDKVLEWQGRNATLLSKFHVLVKRIMEIVKDSEGNRVEVSCDGEGPLRVTEQIKKGNRVLPTEFLQKWG
ncbi:hypothetical protein EYC80_003414 [Monilinia laxa]|uniref:Geranylgeranyl pyrophosphate synthetase n=1 Tax=Monilinia laxa TaxID=61186 RepID=A0A5N6KDP0_MONLA|nr:hypothetical protein EYC80_003414 [Monilinia laxa]